MRILCAICLIKKKNFAFKFWHFMQERWCVLSQCAYQKVESEQQYSITYLLFLNPCIKRSNGFRPWSCTTLHKSEFQWKLWDCSANDWQTRPIFFLQCTFVHKLLSAVFHLYMIWLYLGTWHGTIWLLKIHMSPNWPPTVVGGNFHVNEAKWAKSHIYLGGVCTYITIRH